MKNVTEYTDGVNCWEVQFKLSQLANTIDGGEIEELSVTVHSVPGATGQNSKFVVLNTNQWAIDPDEIDRFATFLKEVCK